MPVRRCGASDDAAFLTPAFFEDLASCVSCSSMHLDLRTTQNHGPYTLSVGSRGHDFGYFGGPGKICFGPQAGEAVHDGAGP